MERSYTWELWGAAHVIQGWASDDTFEYFRCWLISKGRRVFERVLADPDSLADILAPDSQGDLEFEGFAYIARNVWGEKVGKPGGEMPNAASMMHFGGRPSGAPIGGNPFLLAQRYPKLWKHFGHRNVLLRLSGWLLSSLAAKSR